MLAYNPWNATAFGAGILGGVTGVLFIPLLLWSLFWKAWALWKAARAGEKVWFGAMLVLNTAGILEIVYIFLFSKGERKAAVSKKAKSKR